MSSNRTLLQRIVPPVLLLFLLSSFAPLAQPSHSGEDGAHAAPELIVTEADYETPAQVIFGPQVAYLVLRADAADTSPQRDFVRNVTATSSAGTVSIDLLETGPSTGVFTGSFGFVNATATTAPEGTNHGLYGRVMGDARLRAAARDEIAIASSDPEASTSVVWVPSTTGVAADFENIGRTVAQANVVLGWGDAIYYRVTDTDLNVDPATADLYDGLLWIYTDSDLDGEFAPLAETGANTGVFYTSIGFEQTLVSDNGLVYARHGDKVYAIYSDFSDAGGKPRLTELTVRTFESATDAVVSFGRAAVFGNTSLTNPIDIDRATLLVFDPDQDTSVISENVVVNILRHVGSNLDPPLACADVPLQQLGGVAGAYYVTLAFINGTTCGATADGIYRVPLDSGALNVKQTFTAKYEDLRDSAGTKRSRTATLTWLPTQTGLVVIGPNVTAPIGRLAGNRAVQLYVQDMDRNQNENLREIIIVRVKSTSDPIGGIPVTLTETTETSGVFVGSFAFTQGPSSPGRVQVADRDIVAAVYDDPVNAGSRNQRVLSQEVVWRQPTSAAVSTDLSEYFYANKPATTETPETQAYVYVEDGDQNDPRVRDFFNVTATAIVAPGDPPRSVNLTLNEVGVDSGIFFGILQFSVAAEAGRLNVGPGDNQRFRIEYSDPIAANGTAQVSSSPPATWRRLTTGVVLRMELDVPATWHIRDVLPIPQPYNNPQPNDDSGQTNGRPFTIVAYAPPSTNAIQVLVSTGRCSEPKAFNLFDNQGAGGALDGRYALDVTFRSLKSSHGCYPSEKNANDFYNVPATEVGISRTDTVKVTTEGTTVAFNAVARATADGSTRLTLRDPTDNLGPGGTDGYGTVEATFVRTTGAVHQSADGGLDDLYTKRRDVTSSVTVSSWSSAGFPLVLLETAADSNEFVGSFAHTTGATSGAAAQLAVRGSLVGTPQHYDRVQATGPARGLDTYYWFNTLRPALSVSSSAIGPEGSFEVVLVGDDLLSDRIYGETITVGRAQQLVNLAQPFVPGSQRIYNTRVEGVSNAIDEPATSYTVAAAAGGALQFITDSDQDTFWDCNDVAVTGFGDPLGFDGLPATFSCPNTVQGGTPRGVTSVDPATGVVEWEFPDECSPNLCAVDTVQYQYLFASGTAADIYHYTRVGENQIRTGAPLVAATAAAGTTRIILADYTPPQKVTVTSGSGESEVVRIKWDSTLGAYRGTIPVETVATAGNGRIHVTGIVSPVTFRFNDPFLPDGQAAPTNPDDVRAIVATGQWRGGSDPELHFYTNDFAFPLEDQAFGPAVAVQVVDKDADRTAQQDHVMVRVLNGDDATMFADVVLRETTSTSGIFRGYVAVAGLGLSPTGERLIARYNDPVAANGKFATVSIGVDWRPAVTASLTLYRDVLRTLPANVANPVVGSEGALYASISDFDQNLDPQVPDSILALVVSDGDPGGELVELRESNVNTGLFISPAILFESKNVPGNGRVYAVDSGLVRDNVRLIYVDPVNAEGRQVFIRSTPTQWDRTFDGAVDVETRYYVGTGANQTAGLPGVRGIGFVTVTDGDCDLDPLAVDIIGASSRAAGRCPAASAFRVGVLTPGGTISSPLGTSQLVETGAHTGVFIGTFAFVPAAADAGAGTDTARIRLFTVNADKIRAEYNDPVPATGLVGARIFNDEAQWFQAGFGIVEFDKPGYNAFTETPVVRLIDSDLAGTEVPPLRILSNADKTGVQLPLVEASPGVFEAELKLSETASGEGEIHVDLIDSLTATYNDRSPLGIRTARASIGIGEVTAAKTRLVTTPEPDGLRGGYKTAPVQVSFQANKPVSETIYRLGTEGANVTYSAPFNLSFGANSITFASIDLYGNVEEPKTQLVVIDSKAPTTVVLGLAAQAGPGGSINVTWGRPTTYGDPLETYDYVVYRDGSDAPLSNATEEFFVDGTLQDENLHTYKVTARDFVGFEGPLSAEVSAIADATPPVVTGLNVSPTTFDVRQPPPSGLAVSADARDARLVEVRVLLLHPNGATLAENIMDAGSGDRHNGFLDVSTLTEPCVCTLRVEAEDEAGNVGQADLVYVVEGVDLSPPEIVVAVADGDDVDAGSRVMFTVSDNIALANATWQLDNFAPVTLAPSSSSPARLEVNVPVGLVLGAHTLTLTASDRAKTEAGEPAALVANVTLSVNVIMSAAGMGVPHYFLNTTAAKGDGGVLVTWTVPAELDTSQVAGFQVWRAASPFSQVADVNDPSATSYTDKTAEGGKSYRYVVTFYDADGVGKVDNLSVLPNYPGDDAVPGASGPVKVSKGGVAAWVWFLIGGVVLLAAVLVVVLIIVRRKKGDENGNGQAAQPAQQEQQPQPPRQEPPRF